ncbi:hypothetical protein P2G88_14615 [Aliiglaciecola sp. CAU 1673]|uniref:hypothetical protein n=1 Tax=Aliiglaciecola sp. CAU 1673 TaxID=3032595 RepID=UPI0023DAE682|nr:hypothetical protein [Aliiglaciecola sp. CAU 1673]MDF2179484.1 hypothetical protein [Aliiglaciecola sp. CAU 1673]
MYSDEDLNQAVSKGVLTSQSVTAFRQFVEQSKKQYRQDEENFRLITGFNDIFVVIACALVLASIGWLTQHTGHFAGSLAFSAAAWGLAEFFVLRRRMALPAIGLLLAFLGGLFATPLMMASTPHPQWFMLSGLLTAIGGWLHWRRFHVPVTVAAGVAGAGFAVFAMLAANRMISPDWIEAALFACGLLVFAVAMYWDSSDKERITRRSDVAFWLHLLAAPLLVHPIFSALGILSGSADLNSMVIVLAVYLVLGLVSIAVDRRALMVSALGYVIYALSNLFDTFGMVQANFAMTGLVIGSVLLLLSAFWHQARQVVVNVLPLPLRSHLPISQ